MTPSDNAGPKIWG